MYQDFNICIMSRNESIAIEFYQAFKNLDAEAMVALYSDDVVFSDPAFGTLKGERAKNMWRMLIESQKGKEFIVNFEIISNDTVQWEAHYTFSQTNRQVHNKIQANLKLKDGKITEHKDAFNLHSWATQALGFKGWLLGGTAFFRKKLQSQTNHLLNKYEAKRPQ